VNAPVSPPVLPAPAPPVRTVTGYSVPGEGSATVISVVTVIALLVLWWVATHEGWIRDLFLPTPERILKSFADAWRGDIQGGKPLPEHFWASLYRVFAAFALACVTAIPAGIAMGVSRIARGVFDPPIEFYRPLPPLAYLPLIVIWFGIDETAKIVLIYLACFAPLAMAARAGVRSVMIEQINAAYSMGASKWQVIWHVVIPAAMPEIFTGMRIGIGFGWTTLVAAEMVAATEGLGQMVLNASNFLRTDVVIMGIVVIGVVAYAFDLLMRYIERVVVPWKGRVGSSRRSTRATAGDLGEGSRRVRKRRGDTAARRRVPVIGAGLTVPPPFATLAAWSLARISRGSSIGSGISRRCPRRWFTPATAIRCRSRCPAGLRVTWRRCWSDPKNGLAMPRRRPAWTFPESTSSTRRTSPLRQHNAR